MSDSAAVANGRLQRSLGHAGDFIGLMVLALAVPFAILLAGLPLVLLIKAVLWILGAQ